VVDEEANNPVSTFARDEERRVVPRWRFLSDRTRAAELSGDPRLRKVPEYDPAYLRQRVLDWQQSPSFATAADLLTGAVATGQSTEAGDAAEYLLRGRERLAKGVVELAERYLNRVSASVSSGAAQRPLLLPPDLTSLARATVHISRDRPHIARPDQSKCQERRSLVGHVPRLRDHGSKATLRKGDGPRTDGCS